MPAADADDGDLSGRAKLAIVVGLVILGLIFLAHVQQILTPFLWALLAAYLLLPVVNYLNVDGKLPRLWSVALIYGLVAIAVLAVSRYLYPQVVLQGTLFVEDIPRLENALIASVGPRPLGIDITAVVAQILGALGGYASNAHNASHLIVGAFETVIKIFLFLVATFYLLMDGPRLTQGMRGAIPPAYRPELVALGRQINLTWKQYIRGELVLFLLVATVTTTGLTILGVPGSVFLGLLSGALELLPWVGPITAGALAVSVAYFNGTNPFGWSQVWYAGCIALMYLVLRQLEDYLVIPNVLGRAVRLHPVVVLFAVASGGIIGGVLGLIVAVPIAASLKAILSYLYAKLFDLPVEFEPVRTLGGGVIEIPIHADEESEQPGVSPSQRADASGG
ncbi:MAG TPA: AI-2E family transporter [Chloroflexota bacterium]|nr:AI-2E family transporter [Chloroflexota bacterium]